MRVKKRFSNTSKNGQHFYCCIYNQQRNQAGSSPAMEFMGCKACMDFLIGYGLLITTFVSDRHVSIAAYMKKSLTRIIHYFDIWHLKTSSCFLDVTTILSLLSLLFSVYQGYQEQD